MARGLATDEIYTPVITTALKQMIIGLQFAGDGMDDLTTGCQPFLVCYSGGTDCYAALAAASLGHQLSQGEQNASLSDYRTIREQEKVKFPKDFLEVYITLARYAVLLCQGLFQGPGERHPFVEAMWAIAVSMHAVTPLAADRLRQVARTTPAIVPTYHARIVRAVQVAAQEYLQQVAINVAAGVTGVEVPNFQALVRELKQGAFHLSTNWLEIPEAYLEPIATVVTGASVRSAPSGTATTASTSRSGISTLTGDTQPRVARVENPSRDEEFATMTLRPGGTRQVLRDHPPPRNDAGHKFCVVWWTQGGCFPNCRRHATHVPFASPDERTRLLTFMRTHLLAPATNAGANN